MSKPKKPNRKLQHEREIRGWPQQKVAAEIDADEKRVGIWERGESIPSPFYRQKLCQLFGKNAQELGFLDAAAHDDSRRENLHVQPVSPAGIVSGRSTLIEQGGAIPAGNVALDQHPGLWLALSAENLTPLFDEGWTPQMILEALHVLLPGVHAMSQISRRTFGHHVLQLGASAFFSNVPLTTGKHISAEEKMRLCQTLGESIAAGWRLFHTAGSVQVLAIGQAQLVLVQQVHSILPARDRALFYSAIYDLIGKSYFLQENYKDALHAHQSAYIAALQAGDHWRVTQSLICQADGYQACGQYVEAIQTLEEASRVLGTPRNEEQLRSKAHLFAYWADNAMYLGEDAIVQRQLEASAAYLDQLGPNEEFDRAIWLQLTGKHALMHGDYTTALRYYEEAQAELPAHWIMRQVLVLLPMMVAYACKRDRDATLATAKKAVAALQILNAPGLNKQFAESVRRGLLDSFPGDKYIQEFLKDTQQRYPLLQMD